MRRRSSENAERHYLLWDDQHGHQEECDVYTAHQLRVFHQTYPPQDGLVIRAVEQCGTLISRLNVNLENNGERSAVVTNDRNIRKE